MATKTIKFLQGGGFVERQVNADTVEQLRTELPENQFILMKCLKLTGYYRRKPWCLRLKNGVVSQ